MLFRPDYVDITAREYTVLIHEWSEEHSIIGKIHEFMNNKILNDTTLAKTKQTLEDNIKVLNLLLNNKATISSRNRNYHNNNNNNVERTSVELDVEVTEAVGFSRLNDTYEDPTVLVKASDENITTVKNLLATNPTTGVLDGSNSVPIVNLLLGFLIIRYNLNAVNENFDIHYRAVYKLNSNYNTSSINATNFYDMYRNSLINTLNNTREIVASIMVRDSYYYFNGWELQRAVQNNHVPLDLDYTGMSDVDLKLFSNAVTWLIGRHAKYIAVKDKDRESYLMFLGRNLLEGKKRTKEVLNTHLSLENMKIELERRGL